jgi:Arc/MetJ-type ribon-helix-helix transcriptional regulator
MNSRRLLALAVGLLGDGRLRLKTVYLSPEAVEGLEKLVEAGLFTSSSEAVRVIVEAALPEYLGLMGLGRGPGAPPPQAPGRAGGSGRWGRATRTVSIALPPALLGILDAEAERTGYGRSQLVRIALIRMLVGDGVRAWRRGPGGQAPEGEGGVHKGRRKDVPGRQV